jgi:hypothetical protein
MKRSFAFILAFFLVVPIAARAADPLTVFAAGQSVNSIIDQLSGELEERIKQLEGSANKLMMEGRTHAIVMLQNLRLVGDHLLDKTFGQLNDQQKMFFGNIKILLAEWNTNLNATLNRLGDLTADVESAIATIPFADKVPRVLRYEPVYVLSDEKEKIITVRGSWLGNGDPELKGSEGECIRLSKTEKELRFKCPSETFRNPQQSVNWKTFQLSVFPQQSWWEWAKSQFTGVPNRLEYDIAISNIPIKLGDARGMAVIRTTVDESRPRSQPFSHTNAHCSGATPINWIINADANDGWQIDTPSISVDVKSKAGSGTSFSVVNVTSASFAINGQVTNSGACGPRIPFSRARAGLDGRGWLTLTVNYSERRYVKKDGEQTLEPIAVSWGTDPQEFRLPPESIGFTLTLTQIDGRRRAISGSGDYGWVTVEYDIPTRRVFIRPKPLDLALSN